MKDIKAIRNDFNRLYKKLGTWRKVQQYLSEQGTKLPLRTIHRIATDESYYPKKASVLLLLDLPALALHPVCRVCGQVHPPKRCPHSRKQGGGDLFSLPVHTLRSMIENRKPF